MSSEIIAPVFPDRLIHPLPKRRLRERLSPDVADSITYPPAFAIGTPLFYYPYNLKDDLSTSSERAVAASRASASTSATKTQSATATSSAQSVAAAGLETNTKQTTYFSSHARRSSGEQESLSPSGVARIVSGPAHAAQTLHTSQFQNHQPVSSKASSVDGYESFENTNNKKKRKIPTAGDTPHSGSYASSDLHSAASASSTTNSNDGSVSGSPSTTYSGPGSFISTSTSISGPGRGRYGRSRSGRSPLHLLTEAGGNWASRYGKSRSLWPMQPEAEPDHSANDNAGIISNAIANAEKQVLHGRDDKLDQPPATPTPASAQFTFTCSSQVPGNLMWPGSDPKMQQNTPYSAEGRMARGVAGSRISSFDDGRGSSTESSAGSASFRGGGAGGPSKQQGRKKKRRSKIYQELEKQARDRRQAQQALNAAHPPVGDIYICPFCEYEIITGYKPRLILEFEMKERKKRLETERRQREQRSKDKSKNRNRKGRKASKTATSLNLQHGSVADGRCYRGPDDPVLSVLGGAIYEDDDGAGEVDDIVPELRLGIGDAHSLRARGRDTVGMQARPPGD